MPAFIPISSRIGPLTTAIDAIALELLLRAVTPVAASARITGKYSGRAPAITAFTATFSTVYSQYSRKWVDRMRPTTSSGVRRVAASIAATRSSVGSTIGSMSVQLLLEEEAVEVLLRVGLDEPRRRAVELDGGRSPFGEAAASAPRRPPA